MPTTPSTTVKAPSPNVRVDPKKLRLTRQLRGMTQVQLGRSAKLSNSYIGYLERGLRTLVSPPAFGRLCDALSVLDRTELMDDEEVVSGMAPSATEAQSGAMRAGQGAR